jgi:hypothetical protein
MTTVETPLDTKVIFRKTSEHGYDMIVGEALVGKVVKDGRGWVGTLTGSDVPIMDQTRGKVATFMVDRHHDAQKAAKEPVTEINSDLKDQWQELRTWSSNSASRLFQGLYVKAERDADLMVPDEANEPGVLWYSLAIFAFRTRTNWRTYESLSAPQVGMNGRDWENAFVALELAREAGAEALLEDSRQHMDSKLLRSHLPYYVAAVSTYEDLMNFKSS